MSTPEKDAPPVGEEIHLPGGSLQPLGLSVGITLILLGATISPVLIVAGTILSVVMIYGWVRDARTEFSELPAEHAHH